MLIFTDRFHADMEVDEDHLIDSFIESGILATKTESEITTVKINSLTTLISYLFDELEDEVKVKIAEHLGFTFKGSV